MTEWDIVESRRVLKVVPTLPTQVLAKYELWKSIVWRDGPDSLQRHPAFHDEGLSGEWQGYRSCRLSDRWRVIYRLARSELIVFVERITTHDYRKR